MRRFSMPLVLFTGMLTCASSGVATAGDSTDANASTRGDVASMYKAFLSHWTGKSSEPINLAESAEAPSSDEMKQYADCAKQIGKPDTRWIAGPTIGDLRTILGKPESIHFIDPKTWRPLDPGALMAAGASVGSAVSAGVAQGLVTLSAITFNHAHDIAVFNFSFVCGALCGTGYIVVFHRTSGGWVQSKSTCGGYMS